MKFLTTKNLIAAIVLLLLVAIVWITYRMFFQFNGKDVAQYIDEAAAPYADKATAYKLIHDGVEYILASHNRTQQVLTIAKANGTPKEQELVHSAVLECIANGYLTV